MIRQTILAIANITICQSRAYFRRTCSTFTGAHVSRMQYYLSLKCAARSFSTGHSLAYPKLPGQEEQVAVQQKFNEEAGQLTELVRDFLEPAKFYEALCQIGIEFYCGVPDSLLKDFCAYVTDHVPSNYHLITANEGNAIALATGYHLATGKNALVYFQNSGLGNTVNPLMSLTSAGVYSIPMLLMIGWRGEPGKRDEPQHLIQGQATPGLLAALGIPFQPLPDYQEGAEQALQTARQHMESSNSPYAFLVKRQTFLPYKLHTRSKCSFPLTREKALKVIVDELHERDVIVGTTGMLSRELFEHRVSKGQGHEKDFLTVGSMGHASAIALGISMFRSKRQVFCLDGDGSVLMHMGTMATVGQNAPPNFKHVIINNGMHDSVGGQPTDAGNYDSFSFTKVALGCGYSQVFSVEAEDDLKASIKDVRTSNGPVLLEIKTRGGGRKDLGRPTKKPVENKTDFMHFLAIS